MMSVETIDAYLQRREDFLTHIHPNWANDETGKKLICIPPNWDLIKSYTGMLLVPINHFSSGAMPDDGNADFNPPAFEKTYVAGEPGEAEFLRQMQEKVGSLIGGGLLIGSVYTHHVLNGDCFDVGNSSHAMPKNFSNAIGKIIQKSDDTCFEIDFVLINSRIGIYQIEVKSTKNLKTAFKNGAKQIKRGRVQRLFSAFCMARGIFDWSNHWKRYNAGGAVYFAGSYDNDDILQLQTSNIKVITEDTLTKHFQQLRLNDSDDSDYESLSMTSPECDYDGFFNEPLFRQFAVFLATYRPDCYISPILCVLQIYYRLCTQNLQKINYYKKPFGERQNISKSAIAYLKELQQKNLIAFCEIKFPNRSSDIYFTMEQLTAIKVFDCNDRLTNTQQIVMGSPGSGKSLIIHMKLFILSQIRPDIRLFCITWKAHCEIIRKFIDANKISPANGFQREIHVDHKDLNGTAFDCVLDEQFNKLTLYNRFCKKRTIQPIDYISVAVVSGGLYLIKNGDKQLANLIEPIVLRTNFRSTNAIQDFLRKTMRLPIEMVPGHSFEGIQPEIFKFHRKSEAICSLEQRIREIARELNGQTKDLIALITTEKRNLFDYEILNLVTFYNPNIIPSLEFKIVILFGHYDMPYQLLAASRAICHLIIVSYGCC